MRLDKFLIESQVASRNEAHELIKHSRVKVDDKVAKKYDTKVNPERNIVTVDETVIKYQTEFFYLMNKPVGVISATTDKVDQTVIDLLQPADQRTDLFPVGRLDKDTTGMLLITNDGKIAHRLASPKSQTSKTYLAEISAPVSDAKLASLTDGITLKDGTTVVADEVKVTSQAPFTVEITVHEGKYHEIKRMFGALGEKVIKLHRKSFAGIKDEQLNPGEYRELTVSEMKLVK